MIVKIFIGFPFKGELKMHLNKSALWKNSHIGQAPPLTHTQYLDQAYLGLSSPLPCTQKELNIKRDELKTHLHLYCPDLNIDRLTVYLFPQFFIS